MAEQQVRFEVLRYKEGQKKATYQFFSTGVDEDTTVLVALQDIRRDQDPSLTLRHSCHHASCGTCGMKINGQEKLSCVVKVLDLGTPNILVEPLDNLPLISDLVVDMGHFYKVYSEPEMPYIRESEFIKDVGLPTGIAQYQRLENCLECGLCVSACPITGSDPDYLGPAALAAAWRVVQEPRAADAKFALDWVDNEHGCWRCHVAYECTEVCPSDVDPGGSIMALRKTISKRKFSWLFGSDD
jgi:succinate dehydrogenase / fumarate reductase iron-sulfur subunit